MQTRKDDRLAIRYPKILSKRFSTFAFSLALAGVACSNSGLEKYDTDEEELEDSEDDGTPPLELEECASICDRAVDQAAWLGCEMECDIDIAASFEADANATVVAGVGFAFGGASGGVEGEYDGGGSCDFVLICPEPPTACDRVYTQCIESNPDPETWSQCFDEYSQCQHEEACRGLQEECEESADSLLAACEDLAVTVEDLEACAEINSEALADCVCIYTDCLAYGDAQSCNDDTQPAPLPPPPQQTGTRQWRVSRRLVDFELGRLWVLEKELSVFPVVSAQSKKWTGIRLMSLRPSDTVFRLGLRNGDTLISVNGEPLVEAARKPETLLSLRKASTIRVLIERHSKQLLLTYELTP